MSKKEPDCCPGRRGVLVMTGNDPIDIQRCDECKRFQTDEEAATYLTNLLARRPVILPARKRERT